jgi:hypothetical protein
MKYEDIKDYAERCEEHPGHEGVVSHQMVEDRLLEEIEELRDYIEAQIKKYPVYTTRSKRKPLTDEEIVKLIVRTWGSASIAPQSVPEFARAIERAHSIGGEE